MSSEIVHKHQEIEDKEVSLKELIVQTNTWYRYVISKWVTILIIGVIGGIIGFGYSYMKKPIYTAVSTFVLEEGEKGGGLGQVAGLASLAGIDLGGSGGGLFQGDNILEFYRSRTMVERSLLTQIEYKGKKQLLIDNYIEFNNLRKLWSKNAKLKDIGFNLNKGEKFSRLQDSILGKVVEDINTNYLSVSKPDKKLSIIRVAVNSKNEFFAKVFNDEVVKNVNDFYIQAKTKKSLKSVLILQQKTDSVRSIMNGAISTAAAVVDATPNLNSSRQAQRAAPVQRSQFNAETNKAVLTELVKNLELTKMALRKETPLIQIIDAPIFPLFKTQLSKAKAIFVGFILFSFLTIVCLVVRQFYTDLMKS